MGNLSCAGVTVRAGSRILLDRVDLTVAGGTCCTVMGPSGAGKSTLLAAIAGLVPHAGTITVDGRDLDGVALHRRGIALLFQDARLFPTMTVLDNVAYPLRVRHVPRARRRAVAAEVLHDVGLDDRGAAHPAELSGGERQRVALARALCSEADVLLLDEPLTGLDVAQRRSLVRLLARIRAERELTWLVVTHDPDDAAALGDTLAVIEAGRLVQHGRVDEIRARPATRTVAALCANANLLHGHCRANVLRLGPLELGWDAPDGPVELCIAPDHLRLRPTASTTARLPMSVIGTEHRGAGRVAVVSSPWGSLEVPIGAGESSPSDAVDVWFDPAHLWPIGADDEPHRSTSRGAGGGDGA